MRKIYVCPRCKGVNWKISFDPDENAQILHCSKCGFNRTILLTLAAWGLDRIELDTIDMGQDNTGALTDQEKESSNGK